MSSAPPASIRQYRGRMARSILLTFIPLCLFPLIVAGGAFYLYKRDLFNTIPVSTLITVIIFLVIAQALAALGMWLFARRLTEPLSELAANLSLFIEGNWEQRAAAPGRPDESGLLASLFNQMANDLVDTYRLLNHQREGQSPEKKGAFIRLAQAAASPGGLDDFLEQAMQLINKHFELDCTALYLLEAPLAEGQAQDERLLALRCKASLPQFDSIPLARINAAAFEDQKIPCDSPATADMPVVKACLSSRPLAAPLQEAEGAFEAAVPISQSGQVVGILDLFALRGAEAGRPRNADSRLGPFSIRALSELQALSSIIALRLAVDSIGAAASVASASQAEPLAPQPADQQAPANERREAQSDRLQWSVSADRQLAEMQTLWNISQTISISAATETELTSLFQTIHRQVESVMGELNSFAMTLYDAQTDMIRVPYLFEDGQMVDVAPFPLGEGLTSIVVRARSPLMLVEDTERKARELGAKTIGVPAKSWLGVPMLFGGEVVGVIIAQDINREHRFDEDDQRLLSLLAAQVAVVVRNARLLEISRQQAEHERLVNEITAKILRSRDMQGILQTTADELGAVLGARRARIRISAAPDFEVEDAQEVTK
ncbi:MAG: GAF domain-containing protein [Anaerolineales bacterium]|nr:GAF domain-containing protein [Anaerolineales bacterium]